MKHFLIALLFLLGSISPALATVAIDGTISGTGTTITLSTTNANDTIYVVFKCVQASASIDTVTDTAGLTYTKRSEHVGNGNTVISVWTAFSSGILTSDVISRTLTNCTTSYRATAFGVSGGATSSQFDSDASIPAYATATATGVSTVISTANANDILLAFMNSDGSPGTITRPTGFTQIVATGANQDLSYKVVSATESSTTETYSAASTNKVMVFDAVKQLAVAASNDPLLFGMTF